MLIFAIFLLAFTGSGLHKAVKHWGPVADVTASAAVSGESASAEVCCAKEQQGQQYAHCAVPCFALAEQAFDFVAPAPSRFVLPSDGETEGLAGYGLDRPPRTMV